MGELLKFATKIRQGAMICFKTAFSQELLLSLTSDRWRIHSSFVLRTQWVWRVAPFGGALKWILIHFLESTAGDIDEGKLASEAPKEVGSDDIQRCGTLPQRSGLEKICASCGSGLLVTINLDNLDSTDSKKWLRHNCPQCRKVVQYNQIELSTLKDYFSYCILHYATMRYSPTVYTQFFL